MRSPLIQYTRSADGTRIAYYAVGRGAPLVVTPTPTTNIRAEWQSSQLRGGVAALAERYRLISYDRRGAGLSEREIDDYGLDARIADLSAVADKAGLQRFVLAGQATSLSEAVAYAAAHPERVVRLILMSGTARGVVRTQSPRFQYLQRTLAEDWETVTLSLAGILGGWTGAPEIRRHAAVIREAVAPEAFAKFHATAGEDNVTDLLGRLQIPVLVVHPQKAPFVPLEAANELVSLIPDARMAIVDTHASPLLGDATAAVEAIEAFLSDLDARALPTSAEAGDGLTRREIEVLRLVAAGLENNEIADRLFISVNTVARHLTHIYSKTSTTNRVQAARYAMEHALTE
jgi:pimeloyl-ACP methyl ester carboxylesterase/DNA-binding CsgD family transcriptional regulator